MSGGEMPVAPLCGKAPRPPASDEEEASEEASCDEQERSGEEGSGEEESLARGPSPCSAGEAGPGDTSGESGESGGSVESDEGFGEAGEEGEEDDEDEEMGEADEEAEAEEANDQEAGVVAEAERTEPTSLDAMRELLAKANDRCAELEKELASMTARKDALERCTEEQNRQIVRLRAVTGEKDTSTLQSASASTASTSVVRAPIEGELPSNPTAIVAVPPQMPLAAPTDNPLDYAIAVIMPKDFDTTPVPYCFKSAHQGFPHRVQERAQGGTRQYVVESRLVTTLQIQLCKFPNVPTQRHASETELPFKGSPRFRLVACLASTGAPLQTTDFKAGVGDHFFTPPIRSTDTQSMKNGRLTWSFKPTFLSRNTKPIAKGEVFFRITCVEPALACYNLETETERVLVVARETRKRAAPG